MCLKKENKTLKESTISGGFWGSLNFENMISFTFYQLESKTLGVIRWLEYQTAKVAFSNNGGRFSAGVIQRHGLQGSGRFRVFFGEFEWF